MMQKKTPAAWSASLMNEYDPITVDEYIAGLQARQFTLMRELVQAVAHLEGMVGSMDVYVSVIAQTQGVNYPSSQEVREALAFYRQHKFDEMRKHLVALAGATHTSEDGNNHE